MYIREYIREEVIEMEDLEDLYIAFVEEPDTETLKRLLNKIIRKIEEIENDIIDLDVALTYLEEEIKQMR